MTWKAHILDVIYNASNNELVQMQTLVKSAIVQIDAAPFRHWYSQHYGVEIRKKKKAPKEARGANKKESEEGETPGEGEKGKQSNHVAYKISESVKDRKLDPHLEDQFASGRLLACISSQPGQCGRADGYILEGKELECYQQKIQRKKGKKMGVAT